MTSFYTSKSEISCSRGTSFIVTGLIPSLPLENFEEHNLYRILSDFARTA